jgi:hypothetical protein
VEVHVRFLLYNPEGLWVGEEKPGGEGPVPGGKVLSIPLEGEETSYTWCPQFLLLLWVSLSGPRSALFIRELARCEGGGKSAAELLGLWNTFV